MSEAAELVLDRTSVPSLPRTDALLALADTQTRLVTAEADQLLMIAHIADLSGWIDIDPDAPVLPGAERLIRPGGDATPPVAEFTPLSIGAILGISEDAALRKIGHTPRLRHRLPGTWSLTLTGHLRVWVATRILDLAHRLTPAADAELDRRITAIAAGMHPARLLDAVAGWVTDLGDDTDTRAGFTLARANRKVVIGRPHDTVAGVGAVIDAVDARFLDARLDQLAGILAQGGSTDSQQVRRATALGLLASPARALQLLQASLLDQPLPDDTDTECPARGQRGHTCGTITVDPDRLLPHADVVVHLTDATLADGGLARHTSIGPVLVEWLAELLPSTRIRLTPTIDHQQIAPADSYEVPDRIRQAVTWRNPVSAFPWATRKSTGCDLDHIVPYRPGGPPGQTSVDNLVPLSRRAHRAKTHGGWHPTPVAPGITHWRSPDGFEWLTTPTHTIPTHTPDRH